MRTVQNLTADGSGTTTTSTVPDNFTGTGNPEGTNWGGVTVAGAETVAPANPGRRGLTFQNTSDTEMWLTESGIDAAVGVGLRVEANSIPVDLHTINRISVYCAVAGKTFAAVEY